MPQHDSLSYRGVFMGPGGAVVQVYGSNLEAMSVWAASMLRGRGAEDGSQVCIYHTTEILAAVLTPPESANG